MDDDLHPEDRATSRLQGILRAWPLPVLVFLLALWFWPIHDLGTSWWQNHSRWYVPQRAIGVLETWKRGLWDARWIPVFDNGYGYPLLSFCAPAFSWLSALFLAAVSNVSLALRIHLLLWLAFGTFGSYLAGERFWRFVGNGRRFALPPGLATSIVWLFSAPLISNAYVRGALSEVAAAQILPWIFFLGTLVLGPSNPFDRSDSRRLLGLMFVLSVGILLQNLTGTICIAVAVLMIPLFGWIRVFGEGSVQSRLKYFSQRSLCWLGATAGSLVLTIFFWLPALLETEYIRIDRLARDSFQYEWHYLYPRNYLRIWEWGYGRSLRGPVDAMPLHLGWTGLIGLMSGVLGLVYAFKLYERKLDRAIAAIIGLLICAGAGVWLTTASSQWLWSRFQLLQSAQFPWRFLVIPAFGLSLLAPAAVVVANRKDFPWVSLCLFGLLIAGVGASYRNYIGIPGLLPNSDENNPKAWNAIYIATTDIDEFRPKWAPENRAPRWRAGSILDNPLVQPTEVVSNGLRILATVENESSDPQAIVAALNYFPGWKARIARGSRLKVGPDEATGFLRIEGVPPGASKIKIWFGNTPIRIAAKTVSALGWLAWFTSLIILLRRPRVNFVPQNGPTGDASGQSKPVQDEPVEESEEDKLQTMAFHPHQN